MDCKFAKDDGCGANEEAEANDDGAKGLEFNLDLEAEADFAGAG
jgi:hypothetical protein